RDAHEGPASGAFNRRGRRAAPAPRRREEQGLAARHPSDIASTSPLLVVHSNQLTVFIGRSSPLSAPPSSKRAAFSGSAWESAGRLNQQLCATNMKGEFTSPSDAQFHPQGRGLMLWRRFAPAAGLLLITVAAYAPAFNGAFLWDDDKYISANETLRTTSGLARLWLERGATIQYHRLVYPTFWAAL